MNLGGHDLQMAVYETLGITRSDFLAIVDDRHTKRVWWNYQWDKHEDSIRMLSRSIRENVLTSDAASKMPGIPMPEPYIESIANLCIIALYKVHKTDQSPANRFNVTDSAITNYIKFHADLYDQSYRGMVAGALQGAGDAIAYYQRGGDHAESWYRDILKAQPYRQWLPKLEEAANYCKPIGWHLGLHLVNQAKTIKPIEVTNECT